MSYKAIAVYISVLLCANLSACKRSSSTSVSNNTTPIASEVCKDQDRENMSLVDGYYQLSTCGWPVNVSEALHGSGKMEAVLDALLNDLSIVQERLPEGALAFVRTTPFWLEHDVAGYDAVNAMWLQQ